ncbi:MAG: hypothetical protein ACHQTE_01575 [Candidatus Saccharimonadales bacterium]
MDKNNHLHTQKIDIIKGKVSEHERDAVIAAITVLAVGAAALAASYAVKKEPRLLSPWKMAADSRLGQSFSDYRLRQKAKKQQS